MFGKLGALFRRDYVADGDFHYRKGRLKKAAELYVKASKYEQAAQISLESGDTATAVDLYLRADLPIKAAEVMASIGDDRIAVVHFETAEAYWQAAESALRLGRNHLAARFFEKDGAYSRAAACYEKAGEDEAAIHAWELEAESRDSPEASGTTIDPDEVRQNRLRRARLLEKVGRFGDAAELLVDAREIERAASLYSRARNYDRAVELLFEIGAYQKANEFLPQTETVDRSVRAQILHHCGDFAGAARLFEDADLIEEAAEAYARAEEWRRSALLRERLGEFTAAGRLFREAGLGNEAGRCFAEVGDYESAARAYAEAGSLREAAACYSELGDHFASAVRFLQADDESSARKELQRVDRDHPDFREASLRLLPLLIQEGLFKGALHRVSILDEVSGHELEVEKRYWEGRVYEGLEEFSRAGRQYQLAAAIDLGFEDLEQRLAALEKTLLETQAFDVEAITTESSGKIAPGSWVSSGDVIADRYVIEHELGRGGMSRVYQATDREFNDRLAIKILLPRSDDDGRAEDRLLQEVRICRRISHPNVVRVFDFGRFGDGVFITMELLEGDTVDERVQSQGPLSFTDARTLLAEILRGLTEAHRRRVVHRDLKPTNVFLTSEGAKIMDFGIARSEEGDPSLTRTGHVIGSPMFMSPEQLQGHAVDGRSDLYSLGVLAFFVLTGREPFTGTTATTLALKHLGEPPPKLRSRRPDCPQEWEAFVDRLLAKQPEDRFASSDKVLAALDLLPV